VHTTHQVPSFLFDRIYPTFCDEGPDKVGYGRARVELKVEREDVAGRVEEVDEPPRDLEGELEKVVSRSEGEDGVEGGDGASAGGEDEEVSVAVCG